MSKQSLGIVILILLAIASVHYFRAKSVDNTGNNPDTQEIFLVNNESWARHTDTDTGLRFAYRVEPDGYMLDENLPRTGDDASLLRTLILMRRADFDELQTSTEAREGPPTISVQIFENRENLFVETWAREFPQYSNIALALSAIGTNPIAGVPAIRYRADGLYVSDSIVMTSGGYIFVIAGSFIDENSQIRTDFEPFVNSLTFVPEKEQN